MDRHRTRGLPLGRLALTALVAVVALAPAAGAGERLPSEYRRKANRICREGLRELLDVQGSLSRSERTDPTAAAALYVEEVQPVYRQMVDDLRELGFPSGHRRVLRRAFAAMDGAMDRAVERIEADPAVALLGPGTFDIVNDRLDTLGLQRCGGG
jgi:hypothetical protein